MSLFGNNAGGSGGFGAFGGANNNNQQAGNPSVFGSGGAFGQPAAAAPGFGNTGGGFGQQNQGAFGAATNTGFGATTGGFGANNNAASSPFGAAKPAFGATNTPATGGIFGNAAANTNTGGGFGFGANQQQQPSNAFGTNAATTGGLFGSSKPAFGTATTTAGTTGGLFGATAGATGGGGVFGNAGANTGLGFGASGNQALVNGTTNPPYQAFTEKEAQGGTTNHFQTIAFMPAYAKYSLEELRLLDYAQGRRYGNDSGSGGGGFGGTGFGGTFANNTNTGAFGATNNTATGGGLFGNNNTNTTTTPFGAQPTNNAFGASNTAGSGGLFGAKPAAPSLFSGAATTTTGGGLFGANSNTGNTGAFGNNAAPTGFGTNTNTGGGLFGNQANQNNQQKPFAFSNTTTPGFGAAANTGGAFGANNTGGGLFGNNQNQQQQPATNTFGGQQPNNTFGAGAAGAFGNTPAQNQPATGFGGFGQQPQQQQQKPAFGGGFGTTQATNNTTAQGGLFGNNQAQNAGGLFSNQSKPFGATTTTTQPTGGGLFGSNPTPQANTGGLFGNNQPAGNTGGGLFGGAQNTGATGGLFGNNNAPKPAIGGGLFGNNTQTSTQNTNNGLFGLNTTLNTTPGSLFNNNQQQPQQQQMNNSLFSNTFGAGQQGQQQQQLQGQFTTSINDSPYGLSMMSSMNNFQAAPVGPIASPLSSNIQTKKAALIPHYKIAPRQPSLAPRLGGSFSRSGSPFATSTSGNTASSTGTSLSRSFSSSNKLHLFDSDDSVLSSGSFTPGSGARVASLKKLVIDKKIRDQDLFSGGQDLRKESANNEVMKSNGTKSILKKTVSFDVATSKGTNADFFSANGQPSRETTGPTPSAEEMGFLRSPSRRSIDGLSNGASSSSAPEAQPESSTALAVVEKPAEDKSYGSYWMVPSAQKLKAMTKGQQAKVTGLTIGRRGYGKIRFDNPVDITDLDPEEIPGKVVVFDLRVCTVYPVGVIDKPKPGYGLNEPATITLEDCYPISKDERGKIKDPEHPRYSSHIRRLQNIKDTEFVDYLADEGIWIFKVKHFTTYGLVDSDDDEGDEGDITYDESILRERKAAEKATEDLTPTRSTASYFDREDSMDASDADASGMDTGVFDDTFDFKRLSNGRNARNDGFPTSFLGGDEVEATFDTYDEEEEEEEEEEEADTTMIGESFLGEGSVGSVEEEDEPAEPASEEEYLEDETAQDLTVVYEEDEEDATVGYTNPAESSMIENATKEVDFHSNQRALPLGNDWTEQLNATISPVKKRFGGTNFFSPSKTERTSPVKKLQPLNYGVLDLANDLYGGSSGINGGTKKENGVFSRSWDKIESPKSSRYQQNRSSTTKRLDLEDENALDRSWRKAVRPAWGHDGTLIFVGELEGLRQTRRKGGDTDLKAARLKFPVQDSESQVAPLELQFYASILKIDEYGVPVAVLDERTLFHQFTEHPWAQDAASQHEKSVWALASVLWDPIDDANPDGENDHRLNYMREKRRKEKLSKFLEELVEADADDHAHKASTLEETAFAHLTAHRVEQACAALLEAGDFRLATLLPMIGGDAISRDLIKKQINEWRKKGVLAEIPIAIRALYELLSGNTCFSEGVKAPQEDATQEFFLTQKFGLDWKRGFALKLWYGCAEEDGIGSAVSAYEREMNQWPGNVPAPLPWYHSISQSDNYDTLDILWGLLKIYADTKFSLEDALSPKSIAFSNLNYRLSWQLRTIFASKGIRDFGDGKVQLLDDGSVEYAPGPTADQVTIDFAGGLEIGGLWEWAIFVLLHLIDTDSREAAIRNVLGRHLDELVEVEGPEVAKKLDFLEKKLLIPQKWIFEARALKARHSGEHLIEAEYLLSAQAWNEAHKTVIEQVAPEAIISGDLEQLKAILAKFEDVNLVKTWGLGGQVYLDYITLVEFVQGGGSTSRPVVIKTEQKGLPAKSGITDVAKRLLVSLGSADRKLFLQNVAIREMAGVVGSWVLKSGEMPMNDAGKVLELPLTEDQYLKKTMNLSHAYYKANLQKVL